MNVELTRYPNLQRLFWSTPDLRSVDEGTFFSVIDAEWKWVDWDGLHPAERELLNGLARKYGRGWIGDHHVPA